MENIKEIIIRLENEYNNNHSLLQLSEYLNELHPYDLALVYKDCSEDIQNAIIEATSKEVLASMMSYMNEEDINDSLSNVPSDVMASIIEEMYIDDASNILDNLEDDTASNITELLSEDTKDQLDLLDKYEDGTAGAIMNPNFIKVLKGTSVKDAVKIVTKVAPVVESINTIFVVDENDNLEGILDLKELIKARMPKTVSDVMNTNYIYVSIDAEGDEIANKVNQYDMILLPVLDNNKIVGIITMDDAFDVVTKIAEEDFAKFAGLIKIEKKSETILGSVSKRIPWLAILVVADIFIALVISRFNDVIKTLTILTFFQASVLGLAGNTGTQTLAVSVRKISLGKLDSNKDVAKELGRNFIQGFAMALLLGVVSFLLVTLFVFLRKDSSVNPLLIGLTVGGAIVLSISVSNLVASLIPIIFYKLNVDPAIASGPFITTLNDLISIVIYFGFAMLFLL